MLEVKISIESIDYSNIIDKVLPLALEKLRQREGMGLVVQLLSKLDNLTSSALKAALAVLPQAAKDELAVSALQYYKNDITDYMNQLAADKGIQINIHSVDIEKH